MSVYSISDALRLVLLALYVEATIIDMPHWCICSYKCCSEICWAIKGNWLYSIRSG